jgi:hypothetical protein
VQRVFEPLHEQLAESQTAFREYRESHAQFFAMLIESSCHQPSLQVRADTGEPDEQDSGVQKMLAKNQIAKILIGRHKNATGCWLRASTV